MTKDWILLLNETRRRFKDATWVPLRALDPKPNAYNVKNPGYLDDFFALGSVAIPKDQEELGETLDWDDIGSMHNAMPYVNDNGQYIPADQFISRDGKLVGVELILDDPQPTVNTRRWVINPDLYIALRLIKEGNHWVRPEEGFEEVIREHIDACSSHTVIEIKRPFLLDYLAARNMSLRIAYYRHHVENVGSLEGTEYEALKDHDEPRENGRFSLRVTPLNRVYGGSAMLMRTWRTDVDEDSDAPVMGPETNDNINYETSSGVRGGFPGIRVEGRFWGQDWIRHDGRSTRIRGDEEDSLPDFIIETDGTRADSASLRDEDIGRWLWFKVTVMIDLLKRRGYAIDWCTRETAQLRTPSGYVVHFGINAADLVTVYAYDIARLPAWEQRLWYAHNAVPDGRVSKELLASQVRADPANTLAPERLFPALMSKLEASFLQKLAVPLFSHPINPPNHPKSEEICRFLATDEPSLLHLAKDLVRAFSDRLNIKELRALSTHPNAKNLGSIKLLQSIVAEKVGADAAQKLFRVVVGVYELRTADAHPTSSSLDDAFALAGVDRSQSPLRQAEQMLDNYCRALFGIGQALFAG